MSLSLRTKSRSKTPRGKDSTRLRTSFLIDPEEKQQALASLNQTQKLFEKKGKFMQAQNIKKQGEELKQQYFKKQFDGLKKDHTEQSEQIYLIHELEIKKFQIARAKRMTEYSNQIKQRQDEMSKRHDEEIKTLTQQLEKQYPLKLRQSPQLMNYKKVLEKLVKQEKYFEAHQLQNKINILQKQQNPRFIYQRNKRIENAIFQKKEKQKSELKALKQKLKSNLDQIKKTLNDEEKQIKQKYYNIMSDLELSQKSEIRKLEKVKKIHKDKYSVTKAFTYLGN